MKIRRKINVKTLEYLLNKQPPTTVVLLTGLNCPVGLISKFWAPQWYCQKNCRVKSALKAFEEPTNLKTGFRETSLTIKMNLWRLFQDIQGVFLV